MGNEVIQRQVLRYAVTFVGGVAYRTSSRKKCSGDLQMTVGLLELLVKQGLIKD